VLSQRAVLCPLYSDSQYPIRPYQELSPPHSTMVWIDGYCDDHKRDSYEENDVQA
jgi:hypothetical protein